MGEVFLSILLVSLAGLMILWSTGYFVMVSPAGIFYGLFVLFIFIGTILISVGDTLSYAQPVRPHPIELGLAISMFAAGVLLTSTVANFDAFAETQSYAYSPVVAKLNGNFYRALIPFLALLTVWIGWAFTKFGSPLFGGVAYVKWVSQLSWEMVGITVLLPFLTLLFLTVGYAKQDTRYWRLGVIALILTSGFMILTSRRYPMFDFAIWATCLYLYIRFRNFNQIGKILGYGLALGVTFFVGIELIRNPGPGPSEGAIAAGVRYLRNRIILSEATGVNYILEHYPQETGFLHGQFMADQLISLYPGLDRKIRVGNEIFDSVFTGEGGYLPPTMIGELYIDFGLAGFVGLFVWGVILQTVFMFFIRIPKTVINVVLFAVITGLLGRSLITGILTPINQLKYLALVLFPLILLGLKFPEVNVALGGRDSDS